MTKVHPRLSRSPTDFSRITRGSAKWFTGSGWRSGKVVAVHSDRAVIEATNPTQKVVVRDARNINQ